MANADINPPQAFLDVHPGYGVLLANPPVSAKFAEYETTAVRAKRLYTLLGLISLGAAFLTMTTLIYTLTLGAALRENGAFSLLLGVIGAVGIAAQLGLLATPLKRRWLGARFAAERIRGIKFQAVAHAAQAGDSHAAAVESFTAQALATIAVDLDKPSAAMREFDPDAAVADEPAPAAMLAPQHLAELKTIYRTLRLDYQINHAQHCIEAINEERKLPAAASEISFWLGAGLGFADLVFSAFGAEHGAEWRHFLTLFFFVSSAILFVLERGRSHNAALERYEDYGKALSRVAGALERAETPEAFVACVRQGERTAMRELKAFCREADKSTYLF